MLQGIYATETATSGEKGEATGDTKNEIEKKEDGKKVKEKEKGAKSKLAQQMELFDKSDSEDDDDGDGPAGASGSAEPAPKAKGTKEKRVPKRKGEEAKTAKVNLRNDVKRSKNEMERLSVYKFKQMNVWGALRKRMVTEGWEVVTFSWGKEASALMKELGIDLDHAIELGLSLRELTAGIQKALEYAQMELTELENQHRREMDEVKREEREAATRAAKPVRAKSPGAKTKRKYRKAVVFNTSKIPVQYAKEVSKEKGHGPGEVGEAKDKEWELRQCLAFFVAELNEHSTITREHSAVPRWNDMPDEVHREILGNLEIDLRTSMLKTTKAARATYWEWKEFVADQGVSGSSQRPDHLYPSGSLVAKFLKFKKEQKGATQGAAKKAWSGLSTMRNHFGVAIPERFSGLQGLIASAPIPNRQKRSVSPRVLWILEVEAAGGCRFSAAAVASIYGCMRAQDAQRCRLDLENSRDGYF